jgi:hypothetical protein
LLTSGSGGGGGGWFLRGAWLSLRFETASQLFRVAAFGVWQAGMDVMSACV